MPASRRTLARRNSRRIGKLYSKPIHELIQFQHPNFLGHSDIPNFWNQERVAGYGSNWCEFTGPEDCFSLIDLEFSRDGTLVAVHGTRSSFTGTEQDLGDIPICYEKCHLICIKDLDPKSLLEAKKVSQQLLQENPAYQTVRLLGDWNYNSFSPSKFEFRMETRTTVIHLMDYVRKSPSLRIFSCKNSEWQFKIAET